MCIGPSGLLLVAVQYVASEVKTQIDDFKPYIPLIQGLRNPGMRNRHWELLSDELGFTIKPKQTLTFEKCLELGLQNHIDKIAKVAEVAGKEYSIEQVLVIVSHRSLYIANHHNILCFL